MTSEFDVLMKFGILYDFRTQHAYKQPISIIATAVGVILAMFFFRDYKWYYLAAGIVLVLYLPLTILYNTALQMTANPAFKNTIHYTVNDEGITVSVGDQSQTVAWDAVTSVRNTSKSYFLYTSKKSAFIFPLACMGEERDNVLQIICKHVDPKKVKIRFGGL